MTPNNSSFNIQSTDLVSAFDDLALSLNAFCSELKKQQPNCWVALNHEEKNIKHIDKACNFYQDIWYKDQQDGRETRSCYGLVIANKCLLELASTANSAKDRFKALVQKIQKNDKDRWLTEKTFLNARHSNLRQQLYHTGYSRIHLKQLYRHIPILPYRPVKIGFTWYCNGRSIKRISVAQAQHKLLAMGEGKLHIQQQLKKLNTLPEHEVLAQIQTQVPVVRANLVYKLINDKGGSETIRKAMNVSLPILIPDENIDLLPSFNQIEDQPPAERTRIVRNDFKICEAVFLPSLRVHRYIE